MHRLLVVLSGSIISISLLGCASLEMETKARKVYCPKCKVELAKHEVRKVRHKAPGRSMRRHTHVKYICPSG